MHASSRTTAAAAAVLTLVLVGVIGKWSHARSRMEPVVGQLVHRLARSIAPVSVSDRELVTEIRDAVFGDSAAVPADPHTAYESYLAWALRAKGSSFPPLGGDPAATINRLRTEHPQTWQHILSLAVMYARDTLPVLGDSSVVLDSDSSWLLYPPGNNDLVFVWEIATLQHLPLLAEAYLGTGDSAFLAALRRHLRGFLRANPVDNSPNWDQAMEVSIRLYSLIWTAALLERDPAATDVYGTLVRIMYAHACWVADHLDRPRPVNNHAIFAAAGLYFFTAAFPEFKSADRWRRISEQRLWEESFDQYTADGAQKEFAPTYQKALADVYVQFVASHTLRTGYLDPALAQRIRPQLDYLWFLTEPDGMVPQIGDSDDHHWLRLTDDSYADARSTAYLAQLVLGECFEMNPPDDAVWNAELILGDSAYGVLKRRWARRSCEAPVSPARLRVAKTSGMVRVDEGVWGGLFKLGTMGAEPRFSGHSHADFGSFILWKGSREVVTDPGTYTYLRNARIGNVYWRDALRSTAMHSTLMVDSAGQAESQGDYGMSPWFEAALVAADTVGPWIVVAGYHDGYERLHAGRVWRVVVCNAAGLVVADWLPQARGPHRYDEDLTLAFPGALARFAGRLQLPDAMGPKAFVANQDVHVLVGSTAPIAGWRSRAYGELEPTAQVRAEGWVTGKALLAYQLVMDPARARPATRLVETTNADGTRTLLIVSGLDSARLNFAGPHDRHDGAFESAGWRFDGIGVLFRDIRRDKTEPLDGTFATPMTGPSSEADRSRSATRGRR